jgi:hypothetical protein
MRIEFCIGVVTALAVWVVWKYFLGSVSLNLDFPSLYLTQAQLDAEMLGFLTTILAIIYTQLDTPRLKRMRDHPSFDLIWKVFINAIKYLAVALLSSILVLVSSFMELLVLFNLMAVIVAVFRVGRCIWILEEIITLSLMQPPIVNQTDSG